MKSELWQRLKAARDYADKRQEDIAKACGVSRGAVALWERHIPEKRTRPDVRQIQVIAKVTGVPVEWLLNDNAEPSDVWRIGAEAKKTPTTTAIPALVKGKHLSLFANAVEFELMQRAPQRLSGLGATIGPVVIDFAWGKHLVVFAEGDDIDKIGRLLAAERVSGGSHKKHLVIWSAPGVPSALPPIFGVEVTTVSPPAEAAAYIASLAD